MTKRTFIRLSSAAVIVAGAALLFVRTDRPFIELGATEGQDQAVILEAGTEYEQQFTANVSGISRVGLFLRPAVAEIPDSRLQIELWQHGAKVGEQTIPVVFLDAEGASQARFTEPVAVNPDQPVSLRIRIPPDLNGVLRAQTRLLDESIDPATVSFSIDNVAQSNPLAYQVYAAHVPPLAIQLGGLLILIGVLGLTGPTVTGSRTLGFIAVVLAALFVAPALLLGEWPIVLFLSTAAAAAAFAFLLHRLALPLPAVIAGASLAAFTSWWPLHIGSDWQASSDFFFQAAALKDIFLDPNQRPTANGGNWEHFGSYIGFIGLGLALIGGIWHSQRWLPLAVAAAGLLAARATPDGIIVVTFALAVMAALGMDVLHRFLGRDWFITCLLYIVCGLLVLDLFNVAAPAIQFSLL